MENCTDNFSKVTAPRVQQRKIELMDIATSQESGAKGYKISSSIYVLCRDKLHSIVSC